MIRIRTSLQRCHHRRELRPALAAGPAPQTMQRLKPLIPPEGTVCLKAYPDTNLLLKLQKRDDQRPWMAIDAVPVRSV